MLKAGDRVKFNQDYSGFFLIDKDIYGIIGVNTETLFENYILYEVKWSDGTKNLLEEEVLLIQNKQPELFE